MVATPAGLPRQLLVCSLVSSSFLGGGALITGSPYPEHRWAQPTPNTSAKAPDAWQFIYPFGGEDKIDGGGHPWKLFEGTAPGENSFSKRTEAFVSAQENDPIAKTCCPGDIFGKWFYNVSEPVLLPFIIPPTSDLRTDAAIIVAPGGGFRFLAWHKEGTKVAKWLNSMGFHAFVLKYRVPDLQNKILIDAQRAVTMVRARAGEFGINPQRIGFMGFSAGGILTAQVSCSRKRAFTDTLYRHISHKPNFALIIYGTGDPELARYAPPTFIALAQNDQCIPVAHTEKYHMALREAKVPSEIHVFSEGRHGYGDCSAYTDDNSWWDVCAWTANAVEFLYTFVLKKHPPVGWWDPSAQRTL